MSNLAPVNQAVRQLAVYLESSSVLERFLKLLPPDITPQKFVSQALILANNSHRLAECSHQSIYVGMMQAAELGLELSGPLGHAYLVPRYMKDRGGWTATFQVGYRGLLHLALRSDRISNFQLRKVKLGEKFSVEYGDYPKLSHTPILFDANGRPVDSGDDEVIAYYCLANFVDGGKDFEVMTFNEALRHRDRFASTKSGGPWYDMTHGFHEMALKTVARRLCKRSPVSVKLVKAAVLDEYHEADVLDYSLPVTNVKTEELAARLGVTDAEFEKSSSEPLLEDRPQVVS